jgi:AraC-like DNA-binding protein
LSAPEYAHGHGVVLVRSGVFRWRSAGRSEVCDPGAGYLFGPGAEAEYAHPAGGDVCTAIHVDADLWRGVADPDHQTGQAPVRVEPRLELAHRLLVRAGDDPGYAAAEHLLELLAGVLAQRGPVPAAGRSAIRRRALADRAREALAAGGPGTGDLVSLARLVGASPYHLSRTFREQTGTTVTRYRERLRVSRALARLEHGERDLAGLAAALGYADQAHLTRALRAAVGHTPGQLRRLLGR